MAGRLRPTEARLRRSKSPGVGGSRDRAFPALLLDPRCPGQVSTPRRGSFQSMHSALCILGTSSSSSESPGHQ